MNYWLDLFTGKTWKEFRNAGATVTGFTAGMRRIASRVQPGDTMLCYVTGVQRWVGALEVIGTTSDMRRIWSDADYPIRFNVRPVIVLDPVNGVPMEALRGRVEFYKSERHRGKFRGFVRRSPNSS